jgi:hypothetical protein
MTVATDLQNSMNSFDSLCIIIKVCNFLTAKVAVQIVDYYNLALNTLEQSGCDDCPVSETVGSKIYKVNTYITP